MPPDHKPAPTREEFAALSPQHAVFADAGGYDAIRTLHRIATEERFPYAVGIELGDDIHASGFVPDGASVEVQCAALSVKGDLESLLSGLAAFLAVPVGPQGDGDLTEGG
jgi:hypothetical protein